MANKRKRRKDYPLTIADKMVINLRKDMQEMKEKQKRMEKYLHSNLQTRRKSLEEKE